MDQSHATVMMALAFAGLGLLVTGLAALFLRGRSFGTRALVALVVAGGTIVAAAAWDDLESAALTASALFAVQIPYLLLASPTCMAHLVRLASRPATTALGLCAAGLATVLGAFVWFDLEDARRIDVDMSILAQLETRPPLFIPTDVQVRTDRSNLVVVKAPIEPRPAATVTSMEHAFVSAQGWGATTIRTNNASDNSNCHGWVFTGGRYWIEGANVDAILQDNGYAEMQAARPGDLVVYRTDAGVVHSAVVRYVTPGQPVLVEGKWGTMGIYLHRVGESVYGQSFTYYRSPRPDHLLTGLDSCATCEPVTAPSP